MKVLALSIPCPRLYAIGHMGNWILFFLFYACSSRIYYLAYVAFQKKLKKT